MAAVASIFDFRSERFELFLIYESLSYFLLSYKSINLSVQEKKKIDFQHGRYGDRLGYFSYFGSTSHLDISYQI